MVEITSKEGHMEKLPDRFRCEGCGRVLTDPKEASSHRDVHGLVVNIGPDLTPTYERTVSNYRVQIKNQQGEWHDAGSVRTTPGEIVTELYEVLSVIQKSGMTRYTHARILASEITHSQLGSEVRI